MLVMFVKRKSRILPNFLKNRENPRGNPKVPEPRAPGAKAAPSPPAPLPQRGEGRINTRDINSPCGGVPRSQTLESPLNSQGSFIRPKNEFGRLDRRAVSRINSDAANKKLRPTVSSSSRRGRATLSFSPLSRGGERGDSHRVWHRRDCKFVTPAPRAIEDPVPGTSFPRDP